MARPLLDPRWIVLSECGAYCTLGRFEPTADDVARSADAMTRQGKAGWIVRIGHSLEYRTAPAFGLPLAVLGSPSVTFDVAVAVCKTMSRR